MSVVSNVVAVPSRLRMLWTYLASKGEAGETEARLEAFMAPACLRKRKTSIYDGVFLEARKLGLLGPAVDGQEGKVIAAPPPRKPRPGEAPENLFVELVEPRLVVPEVASRHDQARFAPTLAWFLMQSTVEPMGWDDNPGTRIAGDLGSDGMTDISNPIHFQNFCYWARSLGYATLFGAMNDVEGQDDEDEAGQQAAAKAPATYVLPDPTRALERHLPGIFATRSRLRAMEFMEAWSRLCPVVEGGAVRGEVEACATRAELARGRDRFSASTSLALDRLNRRGVIRLDLLDDADAMVTHDWWGARRVSHVEFQGKAGR